MAAFIFALASIVGAMPLAASIPVGLRLTLLSADRNDEALNRGFLAILVDYQAFLLSGHPAPIAREALSRCTGKDEVRQCVRAALGGQASHPDHPSVVVLTSRIDPYRYRWQCFGVGAGPWSAARQDITLDLKIGLFGKAGERFEVRRRATACIMAAASEAQGRVSVPRD